MSHERDFEQIKRRIALVLKEIPIDLFFGSRITAKPRVVLEIKKLISSIKEVLPNHSDYLDYIINTIDNKNKFYSNADVRKDITHILDYIKLEEESNKKIKELKLFDSAYDKIVNASECLRKDEITSVFHSLNTSLELILKEKLDIPTTLRGINTSNIIEILAKHKIGPHRYLIEARARVLELDNKIKHQGYKPSPREAIDAIKIMEELWAQLNGVKFEIPPEVQDKIYSGI